MKLLRIEEVSYKILYVEDGSGHFSAYKKIKDRWEKYGTEWRELKDKDLIKKLEEILTNYLLSM